MKDRTLTLPTIALIAGTRAALGLGIGLLASEKFAPQVRRAAGWALVALGGLTTIPLVAEVLMGSRNIAKAPRNARRRMVNRNVANRHATVS